MNIDVLKPENKSYLEQYKVLGFKSKPDMINEALDILRKRSKQKLKRDALIKAGKSYAQDNGYAWADLDGDGFENW